MDHYLANSLERKQPFNRVGQWSTKKDEMINYGGGMPSADGIVAAFPHKILENINGTPSRIDIDDSQEKQTENAVSRPSTRGGGAHGFLKVQTIEVTPRSASYKLNVKEHTSIPCKLSKNGYQKGKREQTSKLTF